MSTLTKLFTEYIKELLEKAMELGIEGGTEFYKKHKVPSHYPTEGKTLVIPTPPEEDEL